MINVKPEGFPDLPDCLNVRLTRSPELLEKQRRAAARTTRSSTERKIKNPPSRVSAAAKALGASPMFLRSTGAVLINKTETTRMDKKSKAASKSGKKYKAPGAKESALRSLKAGNLNASEISVDKKGDLVIKAPSKKIKVAAKTDSKKKVAKKAKAAKPKKIAKPKAVKTAKAAKTPAPKKEGGRKAQLEAMMRQSGGAAIDDICKTMGWLPHSARAAIAGVKKTGGPDGKGVEITTSKDETRGTVYTVE